MTEERRLAPPTNALALAGLVLGIVALVVSFATGLNTNALLFGGVFAILALIFGFIGINTANRLQGHRRGLAIAAVILGFLAIPLGAFLRPLLFGF